MSQPITVDPSAVHDIIVARLSKQNADLIRENAMMEVYVKMLQNQITELSKAPETESEGP
jgi:hypothetical protein